MRGLLLFFLIVLITISVSLYSDSFDIKKHSIGAINTIQLLFNEVEEREQKKDTIRFVGDVMLARHVETLMNTYGSEYPFSELPQIASTSLLVGNFEAAIPKKHQHTPDFTFSFSVASSHIPALYTYGFTHFGLANNHTLDYDLTDFAHTKEVLGELNSFGHPTKIDETSIHLLKIGSSTIALVAISFVDNDYSDEDFNNLYEKMSKETDFQIAYVHWGTEYDLVHSVSQEYYVKKMIDIAGFDAVIGHHPHVVQDIQIYNDAVIFYSLGNFIFDQYFSNEVQVGLMVDVKVNSEEKLMFELNPVTSVGTHSVPRLMAKNEKDSFLTELAKRSNEALIADIKKGLIISP